MARDVIINLTRDGGEVPLIDAEVRVHWIPTSIRTTDNTMVLPEGVPPRTIKGETTFKVEETEHWWAYNVIFATQKKQWSFTVQVPTGEPIVFHRLPQIDPNTLEPTVEPEAAWWEAVKHLKGEKGDPGKEGPRGLPGVNAVPAAEAVASYIEAEDSPTRAALNAAIDEKIDAMPGGAGPLPTPFERTGELTTWDDETAFWGQMAEQSGRVAVETVGTTVGGRPIRMVSIGYPAAPPAPESIDANSFLLIAYQHGGEPASREAAMKTARNLAFSENPDVQAYLRDHPVRILPTVNADKVGVWTNDNLNDVNINRTHLDLSQPEGVAIHNAIRRVRPHLILDAHEQNAPGLDFSVVAGRYGGAHPAINQVINELYVATTKEVAATGSVTAEYGGSSQEQRTLHISGALAHAPTTVFETNSNGQPVAKRVADHVTGMRAIMEYHRRNAAKVRAAMLALWSAGPSSVYLQSSNIITPAPTGYRMTASQWAEVADEFAVHGIQVTADGTDRLVTLNQVTGWLVPDLIDPSASWPIGTAARLTTPIPDYITPSARKVHGAEPRTYAKAFGEDPVGTAVSGVSNMLSGTLSIVAEAGATHGRALKMDGTSVGVAITAALTDPLVADSEVLFRWKSSSVQNGHGPSGFLRMTGVHPSHNGYRGGYRHVGSPAPATGGAQLAKVTNGTAVVLGVNTRIPLYEASTWYITRFRVQGELLTLTIWKDGTPTPILDQHYILDTTYKTGWAGVGKEGASGELFDWMVHATGGAQAVRPS